MMQDLLRKLVLDGLEHYGKVCKVNVVNGFTCDVSPVDGDADLLDVRLIADLENDKSFILVPKVDSFVVVGFLTDAVAYVTMVSEVDKVYCKIGNLEFQLASKFLIKKGDDSIKDVLQLIIEAVQQITVIYGNNPDYAKLGQAETKINNLFD